MKNRALFLVTFALLAVMILTWPDDKTSVPIPSPTLTPLTQEDIQILYDIARAKIDYEAAIFPSQAEKIARDIFRRYHTCPIPKYYQELGFDFYPLPEDLSPFIEEIQKYYE